MTEKAKRPLTTMDRMNIRQLLLYIKKRIRNYMKGVDEADSFMAVMESTAEYTRGVLEHCQSSRAIHAFEVTTEGFTNECPGMKVSLQIREGDEQIVITWKDTGWREETDVIEDNSAMAIAEGV
jgi:hypothetical protein